MNKTVLKICIYIIFFFSFYFFVMVGGYGDFLKLETKYINSEILTFKEKNNFKKNEYVTKEFVNQLQAKYREDNYHKVSTFQDKRLYLFSIITFFVTLFAVIFLKARYFYVLLYLLPFIVGFNSMYSVSGELRYIYLIFPLLVLLTICSFIFIKEKMKK